MPFFEKLIWFSQKLFKNSVFQKFSSLYFRYESSFSPNEILFSQEGTKLLFFSGANHQISINDKSNQSSLRNTKL